jgi:uncharacterized membrane protein
MKEFYYYKEEQKFSAPQLFYCSLILGLAAGWSLLKGIPILAILLFIESVVLLGLAVHRKKSLKDSCIDSYSGNANK